MPHSTTRIPDAAHAPPTPGKQILLLAAAVSFGISLFEDSEEEKGIGHFIEPLVIIFILVLNATVGVWMVRPIQPPSRSAGQSTQHLFCFHRRATPRTLWRPSRRCSLSTPRSYAVASWCEGAPPAKCAPSPPPLATGSRYIAPPQESELPARELVPGDVVELRVGDKASASAPVPASVALPAPRCDWPAASPAHVATPRVQTNRFRPICA